MRGSEEHAHYLSSSFKIQYPQCHRADKKYKSRPFVGSLIGLLGGYFFLRFGKSPLQFADVLLLLLGNKLIVILFIANFRGLNLFEHFQFLHDLVVLLDDAGHPFIGGNHVFLGAVAEYAGFLVFGLLPLLMKLLTLGDEFVESFLTKNGKWE